MKKIIQKFLSAVILITAISLTAKATNVSGGIYSNTTWTLANSPYIVVDTVVVFPGVTLTIEPGVVVKFDDHKRLDIRQATLIAVGTITDSITFTSNSLTPVHGIHSGVFCYLSSKETLEYCNFFYGTEGLSASGDSLIVRHSNFQNNNTGLDPYSSVVLVDSSDFSNNFYIGYRGSTQSSLVNHSHFSNNGIGFKVDYNFSTDTRVSFVKNCVFENNQTGIQAGGWEFDNSIIRSNQNGVSGVHGKNKFLNCVIDSNVTMGISLDMDDTLLNCEIKYNGIGISAGYYWGLIVGNSIENNNIGMSSTVTSSWENSHFYCNKFCNNTTYDFNYLSASNISIPYNYWCTTDSSAISAHIHDGYDDVSYGLVDFTPVDTSQCYLTGCNLQIDVTVTNANCDTCHNGSAIVHMTNGFFPYTYTWFTSPIQTTQTATGLGSGTYTVCVADNHGCTVCNSNVFVDTTNCTGFTIVANAVNATCSTCNDGSASVSVTAGTAPYYYTWYTSPIQTTPVATGLTQGTYGICVTDLNGCSACDSATVSVGNCSAHFNLFPDTILHHYYAMNMASGVAPLSYSWNWGDGSPFDTVPYPDHQYASEGFYVICLTIIDSAGCTNTFCSSFFLTVTPNSMIYVNVIPGSSTGISEEVDSKSLLIFPNPFTDQLTLILPTKDSKAKIKISNLLGQAELFSTIETQKSNLDVSSLTKGIHILEITTCNKTVNRKIIKE